MYFYEYNKNVNPEKLDKEILNSQLKSYYESLSKQGDKVIIFMSLELNNENKAILDSIIENHNEFDLEDVIKKRILSSIDFGRDLIAEFGAENVALGFNSNQIKEIMVRTKEIADALNSGSLYIVLELLNNFQTDDVLITQDRVNKYKNKIRKFLGLE